MRSLLQHIKVALIWQMTSLEIFNLTKPVAFETEATDSKLLFAVTLMIKRGNVNDFSKAVFSIYVCVNLSFYLQAVD